MGDVAREDAKKEILKRIAHYKRPPRIGALRNRLRKYCGGDWEVECLVTELVKESRLRVTSGLFHLPVPRASAAV